MSDKLKILVPIDSSTFGQATARVAFQLASGLDDCSLEALHVVNVRPPSGNVLNDLTGYVGFEPAVVQPAVYEAHKKAAQGIVDTFVARATTEGVQASGTVATGAVTAEIVAASNRVDLVVMGLRGESEDKHPGQGGAQASNAIPQMSVPTLLVPRNITRIDAFAVGYDGSASASRALRIVSRLAAALKTPVHLIHVGDEAAGRARLDEARGILSGEIETQDHLVQGANVHKVLVDTATAAGAQALVLGFEGQSKIKSVVFGSAQEHLLSKDLQIAVLIAY